MPMLFDEKANEFVLTSGRRVYAFSGRLGIDTNGSEVTYGHDGYLGEHEVGPFMTAERAEIAEWAIARWRAWADGTEMRR